MVKNNLDGRTISSTFGTDPSLGTGSGNPITVTIVEVGKLLPPP